MCSGTPVHAEGGNAMRVAKRTGHTEAKATGKPRGTRPAAFQGQGVLMVTGTPEARTRRAAVKPGHRTARAQVGARTAVPRKPASRKAAARRRSAGRRGHAAAHGRRRAAARHTPRPAARRAPAPAPQASTPQAVPARGAGTAPLRATHHPHGGVAPAGQAGAAAHAGSAKALPPAEPAGAPGGYAEGYRDGVFAGGEALVAQHIPPDHILPAVAAADLIAAGFRQYAPSLTRLASPHEVADQIRGALDAQRPLSVVRLGDGELLTLAADTVLPGEQVQELAPFLPYAGVPRSVPEIRAALAEAIQGADWVGVPISRAPTFQGLLFPVMRHFGIDWSRLKLTSSTINYSLHQAGLLLPILQGRRVLVIGSQASGLGALLLSHGIHVTGMIGSVAGVMDVPRVLQETAAHSFDIALVAAGVPAVILCRRIAGELGRVALDFGHLADKLVTGELHL